MSQEPASHLVHLNDLIEQHCAPEWKELLRERNTQVTFRKGEHIFTDGQVADRMYMIQHGRVKVVASYLKGVERIIRLAGDGEVLGHRGIGNEPIYTATAVALSETQVNIIPMQLFLSTLKANNLLCYHFLLFFAEEVRVLDQRMRDLMNLDVAQRITQVLKMNMDIFGFDPVNKRKLAFTLSRKDIASAAGTTYESVIRTLSDLERQGIIDMVGKEIRILKKRELERVMKAPA
ncbi:MAG: Crp/Fnr family transcriptional regulator [Flavobacteriales bacterium]|nr:Crp/Fnr family transcriptional regulator [Flavobacteriales bacterium]MBK6754222.1 Crp/Fnr family transcriptional regulator [Flavobacteriales bacterium]MBK7754678.1 Crp/Fnr family transcriptional regulator [Flavobacteriales bacterium]